MAIESSLNDLKFLATRFKGLLELADFVEEVGSIENYKNELVSLVDTTKVELEAAKEELALVNADVDAQRKVLADEFDAIDGQNKAAITNAQLTVQSMIKEAKAKVKDIERLAAEAQQNADDALAAKQAEIEAATLEVSNLLNKKAEIETAIELLKARL